MQKDLSKNDNILITSLYASIISACILSVIEIFQAAMFSRMGYLAATDIILIFASLFAVYTVLWFLCLFVIAFFLRNHRENVDLKLFLPTIAFFLHQFFWIMSNALEKDSYKYLHGLFQVTLLVIFAALSAGALYLLFKKLADRGMLKHIGFKCLLFTVITILYLISYIHFKTSADNQSFSPFYSILLLTGFGFILIVSIYCSNKLFSRLEMQKMAGMGAGLKVILLMACIAGIVGDDAISANRSNPETAKRPNILFISIDTLRADHVSVYEQNDRQTSPNIDRIAKQGISFKKAYSTTSWTLPAHASMMTGLFPSRHNADRSNNQTVRHPVNPLPPGVTTLAEMLSKNGYQTAGIISNPFVSSTFGLDQGYDFYDDKLDLFENIKYLSLKDTSLLFRALKLLKIINKYDYDGEQLASDVNKKALRWLKDDRKKDSPFYLFLHYNEPHYPYEPPYPYNKKSNGQTLEYFREIQKLMEGFFSLSSYGLHDLLTLYDGEISYLDSKVSEIIRYLEKNGLIENTLIVITADHGESFNEHEIWQHGNRLYEEQIRVPLIFYYPKVLPADSIDNKNIVQLTDIMPTILDIANIPVPEQIQGRSLLPIIKGEKKYSFAFLEIRPDARWKSKSNRSGFGMKAIIHQNWKYIAADNGVEELYDLSADQFENNNLVSAEKKKSEEMKSLLETFYSSISLNEKDKKVTIDSGRLEQLRQLGYIK